MQVIAHRHETYTTPAISAISQGRVADPKPTNMPRLRNSIARLCVCNSFPLDRSAPIKSGIFLLKYEVFLLDRS